MIDLAQFLARELALAPAHVSNALALRNEGCTMPFIARYRKERTGEMTESQLAALFERHDYIQELEQRKKVILDSVASQGKLTEELRTAIERCTQKTELEDLYLPYRPRKRTRAMAAREKGLGPLAERLSALNVPETSSVDLDAEASPFVSADKGITSVQEALAGASDILAEGVAEQTEIRSAIRQYLLEHGVIASTVKPQYEEGTTKFEMYRSYSVPLKQAQAHNLLALFRGELQHVLDVEIRFEEEPVRILLERAVVKAVIEPLGTFFKAMVRDAFDRLLRPSLIAEVRSIKKEAADRESVSAFAANLRELLLGPPAGTRVTLAVDPGFRTGCKLAVIDGTGKYVAGETIQPHRAAGDRERAAQILKAMLQEHHVELIAVGNGTASRETERFVMDVLREIEHPPIKVVVSEAGASVYSASKLAVRELPELDVTLRGAVSIGRRLQDPLAEMVKIEPKAIGIGQYQHDVDQKLLRRKLEETVESCVNYVGVDVNTASRELLRFVSGINAGVADSLIAYRNQHGAFPNREALKQIPKFGPKTFEQCAGFLRVRGGDMLLDTTSVHPESYPVAQQILQDLQLSLEELGKSPDALAAVDPKRYVSETTGEPTVRDILQELRKPGRDPRESFVTPTFREDIKELKDLKPGIVLEGIVTNVANFGAFVDIGVHHDGLVHVSQLADKFVGDPKSVVKVGQIVKVRVLEVNEQQKRVSLSMRSGDRPKHPPKRKERKDERTDDRKDERKDAGADRRRPDPRPKPESREPREPQPKYTVEDLKAKFNNR
jgi:protein Tex